MLPLLFQGAETSCVCVCTKKLCVRKYRTESVRIYTIQYIRISVFVQSRRVHLFIFKFTIHYSLFKLNYGWQHCSAISLTAVMLFICIIRVWKEYRTRLQSSATGFLMPDQRHFLSLYSSSLCYSGIAIFS